MVNVTPPNPPSARQVLPLRECLKTKKKILPQRHKVTKIVIFQTFFLVSSSLCGKNHNFFICFVVYKEKIYKIILLILSCKIP